VTPPSTARDVPVTKLDSSQDRNSAALATSLRGPQAAERVGRRGGVVERADADAGEDGRAERARLG
jgi:hypothetical protein